MFLLHENIFCLLVNEGQKYKSKQILTGLMTKGLNNVKCNIIHAYFSTVVKM